MDSSDSVCLVCHEVMDIYAVGRCDHAICFKCSTRMRALCEQFDCPICRTDLPEVFFLCTREKFAEMPIRKFISNRKMKINFENEYVKERVDELLEHKCPLCKDKCPEKSFRAHRDHMRRAHQLFYCDLCLELKIFTRERKLYNRHDLAQHRRLGDKDDKSYKGHPLCQFCEERYLDRDELYKHLRKDHYFCHFCESDGSQEFYNDYNNLRDHFLSDHYLCEEGDCANVQFTNAFRSDIDLQAHISTCHSKAQSKAQSRQERTLNIDINLVPRPTSRSNRGGRDDYEGRRGGGGPRHQGGRGAGGNKTGRYTTPNPRERDDIERAIQASLSTMKEEDMKEKATKKSENSALKNDFVQNEDNFPSLKTSQAPVVSDTAACSTAQSTYKTSLADRCALVDHKSVQHGSLNDFPTLRESVPQTAVSVSSTNSKGPGKSNKYVSAFKPRLREDDFPELPSSSKPSAAVGGSWLNSSKPSKEKDNIHKKQKVNLASNMKANYNSEKDFPSLGAPANPSVGGKWAKTRNSNNASKVNNRAKSAENLDGDGFNIIDRFSPVNVPDSPKSEKTKSKKKKKDKVTEIKEEKTTQLKGNSSLEDIASMLMATSVSSGKNKAQDTMEHEETAEKKGKKKEDKVEKRLETIKNEQVEPAPQVEEMPIGDYPTKPVSFSLSEEFPALPAASQRKKPPPGFKGDNLPSKAPPPGLSKPANLSKPPPGFIQQPLSIGEASLVNENGAMPMAADLTNFQYTQPSDFVNRNQTLIQTIQSLCTDNPQKFLDFKTLSGEFRRSEIDASTYYHRCEETLGKEKFSEIFPELMALLPDINKQQELLLVHMASLKHEEKQKSSSKFKDSKGAWMPSATGFLTCQTCRQVMVRHDYNKHVSSHSLDTDFPSLLSGPVPSTSKYSPGPWVKAK